jgi:6-phosphogluconolactonase (cycloisomerase 2 family)
MFSVDPSTGALSPEPGSPFPAGTGSTSVAFSPSGTLLAAANFYAGTVSMFSVEPNTGALTTVAGSPSLPG